ncbi:MAG: thioredoxin [Ruminococcaceae bacterium]|nr:thioredoxin [Oscillospiraceae bacterium]
MELKNFQEDVLNQEIPVLVDFFATWCGPCKMLAPVLEELNDEYGGRIKIVKIDIDKHIELARQFRVATVPTMMIFENGEAKETVIGYHSKEELVDLLGL